MNKMTNAEIYAWNYLENNSAKVKTLKISEIALESHTSPATIIRAVKKMGYSGYSDYKSITRTLTSLSEKNNFSEEAVLVIEKNREEVNKTLDNIDPDQTQEIVTILSKARNIYIVSSGPTTSVANYMANKLELSGRSCIALEDKDFMVFHANKMRKTDLLIVISLFGETEELIVTAKIAHSLGAKILTLTSEGTSTLAQIADYTIISYKSKLKKFDISTDTASRVCLEISSRVLLDMYAIYKHLRNIKRS
ncbi:MAG: MurR/RpiR family transcriptional regulator [Lactococcus sp.]